MNVASKILQRRLQIGVHSVIYYLFADGIIEDEKFDQWAYELLSLQNQHPDISKQVKYYEDFQDWDGTTGFHLISNPDFTEKAHKLMEYHNKYKEKIKS